SLAVSPHCIEQRLAFHHFSPMVHQVREETELARRQIELLAVLVHLASFEIEPHVAELEHVRSVRRGAAQQSLDPGQELEEAERLAHVVVRAGAQSDHLVDFLGARREHDDRQAGALLAELAAQVQPAHPRQHHIEDEQIGRVGVGGVESGHAVTGEPDLVAFRLEPIAERGRHRRIVLHDQDPIHSGSSRGEAPSLGSQNVKALPFPSRLSTETVPPCARTTCSTIDSPSPVPLTSWTAPWFTRWKRSKMRSCSTRSIPRPWSI